MATNNPTTGHPARERDRLPAEQHESDRHFAKAFSGLEPTICDVRNAANLLELVWEKCTQMNSREDAEKVRRFLNVPEGFNGYMLPKEDDEALHYALRTLQNEAQDLFEQFYAAFREQATEVAR